MAVRGVLVAGGHGRRLGVPKVGVSLAGVTLLERALATLRAVADEVVVAAPAAMELSLPGPPSSARRVDDRDPGGGPLAGVVAALEDRAFRVAIVLGVDFPFMKAAMLKSMLSRLESDPALRAIVPAPGDRLQPLAGVYGCEFAAALDQAFESGERSIVRAVERIGPTVVDDLELRRLPGGIECFFNLNTLEDLSEAARRVAGEGVKP
jgi:molybdopterin-guanine dinucleotide biosynthesis protein A